MFKVSRAILFQLSGLVIGIAAFLWVADQLDVVAFIERVQRRVGQMEFWGAAIYPFLIAGCNLLLLPGGVLAIGSGLLFGLWWGVFLVMCGNLIAAAVAFQIARRFGRQWILGKAKLNSRWHLLDAAIAREGWKIIFLSRLHPLFPTSLLNYLYGLTKIRFWTCMMWIALGQLPGLFLYAYLGTLAQLGIKLLRGQNQPAIIEYVTWIGGLLLTLAVTTALGKIALRLMAEVERDAAEAEKKEAGADDPAPLTVH